MWPGWSVGLDQAAGWDVGFTEAISKRMQVPNRLKVVGGEDPYSSEGPGKKPLGDALPPAFLMHVPERLLPAETTDGAFRQLTSDPPWVPTVFGEPPFLSLASRSAPQKRKRPVHLGRARKEGTWAKDPLLVPGGGQSPQEPGLAEESPPEELGAAEMLAMKRQLAKISTRLRHLEEQRVGWRQKELLVYSALLSVCLLDLWLWLRR